MGRPQDVSDAARLAHEIAEDAQNHADSTGDKGVAMADMEVALTMAFEEMDEDARMRVLDNIEDDGCLESEWNG